ncbi:unnamed protein product [Owenia fusiformis]|uniref:CTCHY-type domain-containing protein n=1 Tax=Owenia fusiformis TaxID=6347 RepID=A0A8S4NRR9_OWEFU|nr:unnamed protein product [Owenia fusiformis]
MEVSSVGIDVILDHDHKEPPRCAHGPTLLFEKTVKQKGSQRYFSCSAFRDRKLCNFYQPEERKVSKEVAASREEHYKTIGPKYSHEEFYQRLQQVKQYISTDRVFCKTCSLLLLKDEVKEHKVSHNIQENITDLSLKCFPTSLLDPIENNKSYAQYLFSRETVKFTVKMLQDLGYTKVLCIGAPRIHEAIISESLPDTVNMKSLLLDLDHRYEQFFGPQQFCWYNMFNHHFLDGSVAHKLYESFLESESSRIAIVTDPPYGGRVEVLTHTLKKINKTWQNKDTSTDIPIFWFFPYFMEPRLIESLPRLTMLDYRVNYDNHDQFSRGEKGRKQGSPVRIFTNVSPEKVVLPEPDYRFCPICKRYVAVDNLHCDFCDSCTSKDGRTYVHCFKCQRCVKPSRVHCDKCGRCEFQDHKCGKVWTEGCHICGDLDHKRHNCPNKSGIINRNKRKLPTNDISSNTSSNKKQRRMRSKKQKFKGHQSKGNRRNPKLSIS